MVFSKTLIVAGAVLFLASACVSKPPAKPVVVPETPPVAVVAVPEAVPEKTPPPELPPPAPSISKEDLAALHERVLVLRKQAFDLGAKDLAVEEYKIADTYYIEGKTALDSEKIDPAKISFETAEPLFKDLIAKTQKLVAENRKADADAARVRAEDSGAAELSADTLALADQAYSDAQAAYDAGDHKKASDDFARSLTLFDGAEKRARAMVSKNRIDELNFAEYDKGNYQIASDKLAFADETFPSDPRAAVDAIEEALLRFNLVLAKGWELSAGGNKAKAEELKTKADEIKAAVAVKEDYVQAQLVWDAAAEAFNNKEFEYSSELFIKAETLFSEVYQVAASKRAAAEAAMLAAKTKREQSAQVIQQGQNSLDNPGSSKKAGE